MLIPRFWRRRAKRAPAMDRLARLRSVLAAAQTMDGYSSRLASAHLDSPSGLDGMDELERSLAAFPPTPFTEYKALFSNRAPVRKRAPERGETRSALLVPFATACSGLDTFEFDAGDEADPYSQQNLSVASADLFRLANALSPDAGAAQSGSLAVVVFGGADAGSVTGKQIEWLWNTFEVPIFQQFVGTDGRVIAAECEVHDGLHIREDSALLESIDGEVVFTSLTDVHHPALRLMSGIPGEIKRDVCDCGREEPRLLFGNA